MRITYDQARGDHEYLWGTYGPANDMTGGYVDQDDLNRLLKNPTKNTARKCYVDQICYFFSRGCESANGGKPFSNDQRAYEIAKRHGCSSDVDWTDEVVTE